MTTLRKTITRTLAAALFVPVLGTAAFAQNLALGTMGQGTSSYAAGAALSQILQQHTGRNTTVLPNSGETTILPLVNNGELDLGIASIMEVVQAVQGVGVFENRPQEDILALGVIHPLKVGIYVRADSDIETVADLAGRRYTTGFTAMGTIDLVSQAILASGGLTYNDVQQVQVPNVVRGADDFIAGRVDAFFFALGAAKVLEADASAGGLRLLPIDDSEEARAAMAAVFPYGYLLEQPVTDGMAGMDAPQNVFSYDNLLLINASVPDDQARAITAALVENVDAIRQNPQLRDFDPAAMYKIFPFEYHPGAVSYYEDQGIEQAAE